MANFNWDAVLWIGGGFASVIVLLLGIIAYFIRQDRLGLDDRMNKHEGWILEVQKEVRELAQTTAVSLEHNSTTMEILKDLVMKKKR